MKLGIGVKFGIWLSLLGILATGLTGYYAYNESRDMLVEAAEDKLLATTRVLALRFSTAMGEAINDARLAATIPIVKDIANSYQNDRELSDRKRRLAETFAILLGLHSAYFQIRLIGAGNYGRELVRVDRVTGGTLQVTGLGLQEKGHYPYVYETLRLSPGKVFLSRINLNRETGAHLGLGRPTLRIATPVADPDGSVFGVIVMNVDLNGLFEQLRTDIPSHLSLFLANQHGDYLIHPDESRTFGFERGQRDLIQDEYPKTSAILKGRNGSVFLKAQPGDVRSSAMVAAFTKVPYGDPANRPFVLLGLGLPLSEVLAGSNLLGKRVIIIILIFSISAIIASALLSRFLVKPLKRLAKAVDRFSSGRPPGPLPVQRNDEVGLLARSFGALADQVREQIEVLQGNEQSLQGILEAAPFLTLITDRSNGYLLFLNDSARSRFAPEEGIDLFHTLIDSLGSEHARHIYAELARSHRVVNHECLLGISEDSPFWGLLSVIPIECQRKESYLIAITDITEQKRTEELIHRQANFDGLTGLPNRNLFTDRLSQALETAHRNATRVALLYLDLDQFKSVNDSLGHSAGDMLLKEAGDRIRKLLRSSDTVARLGGDEFAIFVTEADHLQSIEDVAIKVNERLAQPYDLSGIEVFVAASVGISLFPDDGESVEVLLKKADSAMYAAKENGRGIFAFFTPKMQELANARLALLSDLRRAVNRSEFMLACQPICRMPDLQITSYEVLLRWKRPNGQLLSPTSFVNELEETGMISGVGRWAMNEVGHYLVQRFANDGMPNCSINVSVRQFHNSSMLEDIRQALEQTGLPAEKLIIEITESLLFEKDDENLRQLAAIRELGVRIYLDDFGTGYSSLSYLKRFPVDALKIDRSFVRDILADEESATLVETIIIMAHKLGLEVVAEGVETEAQLNVLTKYGCDYAQGYYLGRPMALSQMAPQASRPNRMSHHRS